MEIWRVGVAKNKYLPKSTDVKNSGSGTPRRGEAMLSSQFGDIGKRRREIMARKRLGWSPVSCEEDSAAKVKPQFIFETVQLRGWTERGDVLSHILHVQLNICSVCV